MTVNKMPPARGWAWIQDAFRLFLRDPLKWVIMGIVLIGAMYLLSRIPFLGGPLVYLLSPIPIAGMMAGCRDLELGRNLSINHLLSGFRDGATSLVTLGGVFVVAQILIGAIVSNLAGGDWEQMMRSGALLDPAAITPEMANRLSAAMLVGMMLMVPVALLLWFSPALVILDGVPAGRAMVLSLQGCLANVIPTMIYGLAMMLLLSLVALTLGFGMFVWLPLAVISTYRSYREIYVMDAQAANEPS